MLLINEILESFLRRLFLDEMGRWIGGFEAQIEKTTILHTELWVVLKGLSTAWDHGLRRIIVECDNL